MRSQHLNQSRFNVNHAIAPLRLNRNFFFVPNATANKDPTATEVKVFDAQPERFSASQTCTRQSSEQHFPLASCGIDDLEHFIRAEASLFFVAESQAGRASIRATPFPPKSAVAVKDVIARQAMMALQQEPQERLERKTVDKTTI